MSTLEKVKLLGNAGRFDVCGGPTKPLNNPLLSFIYPATMGSGKCNLFKTLMTNSCRNDCKYCVNRHGHCHKRARYTPQELSNVFLKLYKDRLVDGLFLSSGIGGDPDAIMSEMISSVELLRIKHSFKGYIHLKVLPGTSHYLVNRACKHVDRVSINIETTKERLPELTLDKDFKNDIIRRMNWIQGEHDKGLLPAGQTTQLIVGGAGESDKEVVELTSKLYKSFDFRRIYFSAFKPIKGTPLEDKVRISSMREHRLYQVDYLFRKYGFKYDELIFNNEFLDLNLDPKLVIALNDDRFPLDINESSLNELLRIPGVGPLSAKRIIDSRSNGFTFKSIKDLANIGVVAKKASPFISINGFRQARLGDFFAIAS